MKNLKRELIEYIDELEDVLSAYQEQKQTGTAWELTLTKKGKAHLIPFAQKKLGL